MGKVLGLDAGPSRFQVQLEVVRQENHLVGDLGNKGSIGQTDADVLGHPNDLSGRSMSFLGFRRPTPERLGHVPPQGLGALTHECRGLGQDMRCGDEIREIDKQGVAQKPKGFDVVAFCPLVLGDVRFGGRSDDQENEEVWYRAEPTSFDELAFAIFDSANFATGIVYPDDLVGGAQPRRLRQIRSGKSLKRR